MRVVVLMLESLGYSYVSAETSTWLYAISPIVLLMVGIALALSLSGFGLYLFSVRSSSGGDGRGSAPAGLDKRIR